MQADDPDKLREQLLAKLNEIEKVLRETEVATTELAPVPPPPPPPPQVFTDVDAEVEAIMAAARATAAKVAAEAAAPAAPAAPAAALAAAPAAPEAAPEAAPATPLTRVAAAPTASASAATSASAVTRVAYAPQEAVVFKTRAKSLLAPPQKGTQAQHKGSQAHAAPHEQQAAERRARAPGRYQQPAAALSSILVQGGSLRTWSYRHPDVEQVQVVLSTEGRPLDAVIELWQGPDNTPCSMRVYVENGQLRPFTAVIETPRGPNTVAIRNIGQMEFPIAANVVSDNVDGPSDACSTASITVQGGAIRTFPFNPSVDSVQVLLNTDGRPLNARIELLQGPNNNKQVIELYTEDGRDRPFFCFLETPGPGNVVRIVNTAPIEFPLTCSVIPHLINNEMSMGAVLGGDVVIGGDIGW